MPLITLISVTLERVLKRLLYQDLATSAIRNHLKGKILRLELDEWKAPIILIFSEDQINVLNAWDNTIADCTVRTNITTLLALLEQNCLKNLIKQRFLRIEGDPKCIQYFAELLYMAEFDAAEILSPYFGDIIAEGVTKINARCLKAVKKFLRTSQEQVVQAITDEWYLTPSVLEMAWFYDEVNNVTQACENLSTRLDKLEANK